MTDELDRDDDEGLLVATPGFPPDEELDARAREIAANLLIFTSVRKSACKDLVLDEELRARVRARLSMVGLELVDNVYSEYFAVRLLTAIESDVTFDWSTNSRLNKGAVALLVILWAKLILPKRVAQEQRLDPGEDNLELFPQAKQRKPVYLTVHRDALFAEFGRKFGKMNFQRYLGQLRNMGFVTEDRSGHIGEGPLLDLLVDGTRMAIKLKDSVLWSLLKDRDDAAAAQEKLPLPLKDKRPAREVEEDVGLPEGLELADLTELDRSDVATFLDGEEEPEEVVEEASPAGEDEDDPDFADPGEDDAEELEAGEG